MEPTFWLAVFTAAWMHVFGVYADKSECDKAVITAFGYSCTAPDRPDTVPNCACVPQPRPAGQAPAQQTPAAPLPPQNLPSPLQ